MNLETIQSALNDFIVGEILLRKTPLAPDQDIFDAGCDSLALTRVLVFVEERFGVLIPDQDVVLDEVSTIQTMARFVHERVTRAGK